jgi:large subunit ribosomal protein L3
MTDREIGSTVTVAEFAEGDTVRVSGLSKGRGFQGGVKRHGFGGGPKTHGQKNRFRAPPAGHTRAAHGRSYGC